MEKLQTHLLAMIERVRMEPQEARIEHLKLIQAVIDRMARNSFAMRTVSGSLVVALTALIISSQSPLIAIGGASLLMFWILDAYYLRQERLFSQLYDAVVQGPPADFGNTGFFSMGTHVVASKVRGLPVTAVTAVLLAFYVSLIAIVALVAFISYFA